jgi:uncharacterized delta-60 repeat protein
MKKLVPALSMLIACTFVEAQSQTDVFRPSYSSTKSTEPTNLTKSPTPAWVARYNGPGNADDVARAIAVDGSENVYVTGYNTGSDEHRNYATIKYNSAGVKQWVAGYDGSGNQNDEAFALVVDGSGNIYVTGYSHGSNGSTDYATIKYNHAGVRQWVARYNGPASASDTCVALKLDGAGNVYVTGSSTGSNGKSDYLTIKYNNSGLMQWTARYNGPGNANDYATALDVDNAGNIYVTGRSTGGYGSGFYDYVTIKYNSAGVRQWIARLNTPVYSQNNHDGANAIACDGFGNVYVTGYTTANNGSGDTDYLTIKYNSAGVKQWVSRAGYTGSLKKDNPYALAVDGLGNVHVTGTMTNSALNYDYVTIKYNSAGVGQGGPGYNAANYDDKAYALALDGSGNVYVTGYSIGKNGNRDCATIKYNSTMAQQWVARYNGPANSHDGANAIAVDGFRNVYVTGYSTSSNGTKDYVTIKYPGTGANSTFSETIDSGNKDLMEINTNATLPTTFNLAQNFPNPFNPTTTIRFETPRVSHVKLVIYNLRGELVHALVDSEMAAGFHLVTFDASGLASGIYFYRLEAGGNFTATHKMVLGK